MKFDLIKLKEDIKKIYQAKTIERSKFLALNDFQSFDMQIATWFGFGLIIPASGTWGTIGGMIFGIPLLYLTNSIVILIIAAALYFIGLQSIERIEKKLGESDSPFIVIDEVVAIFIGIALIPSHYFLISALVLFALFRYFDAKKPWLIGWVDQNIKGARGVMIDDLVAIAFALATWWFLSFVALFIFLPMV